MFIAGSGVLRLVLSGASSGQIPTHTSRSMFSGADVTGTRMPHGGHCTHGAHASTDSMQSLTESPHPRAAAAIAGWLGRAHLLHVDDQFELGGLLDGQIAGLPAFQDPVDK